jgi:hypothetical protein
MAIARLCVDAPYEGSLDTNAPQNCTGSFGGGTGVQVVPFFNYPNDPDVPNHKEMISAIAFQNVTAIAGVCGGSTQRILVAGPAWPVDAASQQVWAVARLCPDGTLDSALDSNNNPYFGGNLREWKGTSTTISRFDAAGTVTISFQYIGTDFDWMKEGEPLDIAVEQTAPGTQKIVVGGFAHTKPGNVSPPPETPNFDHFALARLLADGKFDPDFNPNPAVPQQKGRIYFDNNGVPGPLPIPAPYFQDQVRSLQLVADQSVPGAYDILIAGPTFDNDLALRDFFVSRIKYNATQPEGSGVPWDWNMLINFDNVVGGETPVFARDDIALDLVYRDSDKQLIVAGVTCANNAPCIRMKDHTPGASDVPWDETPSSNMAFARLDLTQQSQPPVLVYKRQVTGGGLGIGTYTDVAHSVVLQHLPGETFPRIVIGGFSAPNNGPGYMSGARFTYNNPSVTSYEYFTSAFTGTTGERGDQAWELQVQPNLRIIAGGFHSEGVSGANPMFGVIRLCKNPDETTCSNPGASPSGGGGGTHKFEWPTGFRQSSKITMTSRWLPSDFRVMHVAIEEHAAPERATPSRTAKTRLTEMKTTAIDFVLQSLEWHAW